MTETANTAQLPKPNGLEGVVAAQTELSHVFGDEGRLVYRGYDIHELAGKASFEEVAYLLWMGHLPTRAELDEFERKLGENLVVVGMGAQHQEWFCLDVSREMLEIPGELARIARHVGDHLPRLRTREPVDLRGNLLLKYLVDQLLFEFSELVSVVAEHIHA